MRQRSVRVVLVGFMVGLLGPLFVVGTFATAYDLKGVSRTAYWEDFPTFYGPVARPGRFVQGLLGSDSSSTTAHRLWYEPYVELALNGLAWAFLFGMFLWIVEAIRRFLDRRVTERSQRRSAETRWLQWVREFSVSGLVGVVLPVSLVGFLIIESRRSISQLSQAHDLGLVGLSLLPGRILLAPFDLPLEVAPFASPQQFWTVFSALLGANWIGWWGVLTASRLLVRSGGQLLSRDDD